MRRQFRVLYREFLFRMFDVEVLSAHARGDATAMLGQFAALLVFLSLGFSIPALGFGGKINGGVFLTANWAEEHFLIATTMLVVGLFAVLSWDSTFPDRRDVLVLAPLPVHTRTMFLAKVAAVGTALAITVVALHVIAGLAWPLAFNKESRPEAVPAFTFEPAQGPVDAPGLRSVLSHDLAQMLHTGDLARGTGSGLAIGVSKNGVRRVFTYGTAQPDSIFEIGSVGKTFTALALARMVADQAGMTYPDLLRKEVAAPLGLRDTTVSLSPEQQSRLIQGHAADHRPVHAWDLDALAGAGNCRHRSSLANRATSRRRRRGRAV